jgi:hypothetical protein
MKAYRESIQGREDIQLHAFFTWTMGEVGWLTSRDSHFTPGKLSQYPLNRRQGGSQSYLEDLEEEEILVHSGIRTPNLPACRQSLYQLIFPGSNKFKNKC